MDKLSGITRSSWKSSLFTVLSTVVVLSASSCKEKLIKDKMVVEHTYEVEVRPIKPKSIELSNTGPSAEEMIGQYIEEQLSQGNLNSVKSIDIYHQNSFSALRKKTADKDRLSLRYCPEGAKGYLYIEPGCFRCETEMIKKADGTYSFSIDEKLRGYASILLKLETKKPTHIDVTLDDEGYITKITGEPELAE